MKTRSDIVPVILGSDQNAYGCARIFYDRYGIKPLLLCSKELVFTSHSRILKRIVIKELDTADVFRKSVRKTLENVTDFGKKALLIPCSDYYAELVAKNSESLSSYVENPLLSYEVYEKIRDKEAFYETCEKHGIPYPETLVCLPTSLCGSESPFGYPVVIKPKNSNSYSYLHAEIKNRKKVYICQSKAGFTEVIKSFIDASYNEKIIVQRYIEGGDEDMLTVNAYCGTDGKVRVVGAGRPLLCYRDPQSLGNYAAIRTVSARDVCDTACDFLEAIGYRGTANFDLKRDPKTGKHLFFEINPRAGRSSYFMKTAGYDLITEMIRDCIEKEPFTEKKYAEKDGMWSDIPFFMIKKHVSSEELQHARPDSAVSLKYDFSPIRFAKLAYAMYEKDRLFKTYS